MKVKKSQLIEITDEPVKVFYDGANDKGTDVTMYPGGPQAISFNSKDIKKIVEVLQTLHYEIYGPKCEDKQ